MNTGEKIRTLRTLKGLSQENLADMIGVSRLAYGDMERGKHEISTTRLEQIATALGVTTEEIEAVEEKVSNFLVNVMS
jgi:XRE family transcriptional regulator, regulator of sulfur utilization